MFALIAAKVSAFVSAQGLRLVIGLVVVLAIFLSGVRVESWRCNDRYNKLVIKQQQELIKAQEEAHNRERAMFAAREQLEKSYVEKVARTQRALSAANTDRDQLRDLVAQFNTYSVPSPAASGFDGADDKLQLLEAAARLASDGVQLVAEADRVASDATAAAEVCRDKLTALQTYVSNVLNGAK